MGKYTKDAEEALASIAEAGTVLPIQRLTPTAAGSTGGVVYTAPIVGNLTCVIFPASKASLKNFDIKLSDGMTLSRLRYILAAGQGATFVPKPGDIMIFEGWQWRVLGCTDLDPDGSGEPIILTLIIERQ